MSTDVNKVLIHQYFEALTTGDVARVDQLLAPTYVHHDPVPGMGTDRDGTKYSIAAQHAAFPDGQYTLEHLLAEGEWVTAHWTFQGTHHAEWRGIPATLQAVTIRGMHLFRIAAGQITDEWRTNDALGLLQQLGAIAWWRTPKADTAAYKQAEAVVTLGYHH